MEVHQTNKRTCSTGEPRSSCCRSSSGQRMGVSVARGSVARKGAHSEAAPCDYGTGRTGLKTGTANLCNDHAVWQRHLTRSAHSTAHPNTPP